MKRSLNISSISMRMGRFVLLCLMAAWLCFFTAAYAQGQESASSRDLIAHAAEYDGKMMSYEGELIGAVLNRGDHTWLNLSDGDNAIGAWTSRLLLPSETRAGSYMMRGDVFFVRGVFHRSCAEHGGGLDIHVLTLRLVRAGGPVPETFDERKVIVIFILLGALVCLLIVHILLKRRART